LGSPAHAAENVLSHYLDTGYLWENIRMKGGAYGAFSEANSLEGVFTLMSYRDPNLLDTLAHFRQALVSAAETAVSAEELELIIIGTVAKDLRPRSPGDNGYLFLLRHLLGITDKLRQAKRDLSLHLTPQDLQTSASRLVTQMAEGWTVSFTGPTIIDKALQTEPGLAVTDLGI
ncbi:MAG: hypothetical protein PHV85_11510, partial [Desulfovibrionaceae bacterium]|nr:hypothetical protein [Desulfovibrionaceae bacterium]